MSVPRQHDHIPTPTPTTLTHYQVKQLAGTVCSAMKPFHTVAVGVCSAADRDAVLESVGERWSVKPYAAVTRPAMTFEESLPVRDDGMLVSKNKTGDWWFHFFLL